VRPEKLVQKVGYLNFFEFGTFESFALSKKQGGEFGVIIIGAFRKG
jgi:hypothetical protein